MITVDFFGKDILTGFRVKGHATANAQDTDGKIICAGVSSAAYMTANTITEILKLKADIQVEDGFLELHVTCNDAHQILSGFQLHMITLSEEYKGSIKIN